MAHDDRTAGDMDPRLEPRAGARLRREPAQRARRLRWLSMVAVTATAAFVPLPFRSGAADTSADGLAPMCRTGATPNAAYVLTAHDGYITTPEGNSIYMWSYSNGNDGFQYPGPALCVTEGDTVTITLQNLLPVETSVSFPGITKVSFDGAPATPSPLDLANGDLTPGVPPGGAGTYSFVASHAGTYLYESASNPEVQDQMGLVGALIVRPKGHPDYVYGPAETGCPNLTGSTGCKLSTQFNPDREFLHLLSEIDPDLHACFEASTTRRLPALGQAGAGGFASGCNTNVPFTYDMSRYRARYWMINGRSFPDTIAPNNSAHLPAQPFGALVHVTPRSANDNLPAVVRYLNAGPVAYPFHPHAQHEMIVGQDARPRVGPGPNGTVSDLTQDRFGITVAPGQTLEGFFSWVDAVGWDPNGRPIDFGGRAQGFAYDDAPGVVVPLEQNRFDGEYWSGTPYLGSHNEPQPGQTRFDQCGEFYDVAHSHALFQVTNFGAAMGGMLTMIRVDPIGGCGAANQLRVARRASGGPTPSAGSSPPDGTHPSPRWPPHRRRSAK